MLESSKGEPANECARLVHSDGGGEREVWCVASRIFKLSFYVTLVMDIK